MLVNQTDQIFNAKLHREGRTKYDYLATARKGEAAIVNDCTRIGEPQRDAVKIGQRRYSQLSNPLGSTIRTSVTCSASYGGTRVRKCGDEHAMIGSFARLLDNGCRSSDLARGGRLLASWLVRDRASADENLNAADAADPTP